MTGACPDLAHEDRIGGALCEMAQILQTVLEVARATGSGGAHEVVVLVAARQVRLPAVA